MQKEEIGNLEKEVESSISKEEFRKIVLTDRAEDIGKKYKRKLDDLNGFLEFFYMPFEECKYYQPRYAAHASCIAPLLQHVDEKEKYVVENGKEKLLRGRAKISLEDFLKTFKAVPNYYTPFSQVVIALELEHFSESKI